VGTVSRRGTKGFTLLELLLVLSLIVLMVGLSTVFFANALPSVRLASTGREMAAMLRDARLQARNDGESRKVIIDFDRRRFGIEGKGGRSIPSGVMAAVMDPEIGEVSRGAYPFVFTDSGGAQGGTIHLWTTKKKLRIEMDPLVGSVVVR
jgi:general secretion pathway protein H